MVVYRVARRLEVKDKILRMSTRVKMLLRRVMFPTACGSLLRPWSLGGGNSSSHPKGKRSMVESDSSRMDSSLVVQEHSDLQDGQHAIEWLIVDLYSEDLEFDSIR